MCDTYNCDYLKHSTFRFNLRSSIKEEGHPKPKLSMFVRYLKIINTFFEK